LHATCAGQAARCPPSTAAPERDPRSARDQVDQVTRELMKDQGGLVWTPDGACSIVDASWLHCAAAAGCCICTAPSTANLPHLPFGLHSAHTAVCASTVCTVPWAAAVTVGSRPTPAKPAHSNTQRAGPSSRLPPSQALQGQAPVVRCDPFQRQVSQRSSRPHSRSWLALSRAGHLHCPQPGAKRWEVPPKILEKWAMAHAWLSAHQQNHAWAC
jgi:hypothetical protein